MSLPSPESLKVWRVTATVVHSLAIVSTAFRLTYRVRIRRFWWDDFCAFVALVLDAGLLACLWIQAYVTDHQVSLGPVFRQYRIPLFWTMTIVLTFIITATRISIASSITRILPPGTTRTVSAVMSAALFVMCLTILAERSWICGHDPRWHSTYLVDCPLGDSMAATQLAVDVISSAALVAFPLHVLWRVDLPPKERRLILSLFAASMITTIVCIVHNTFIIGRKAILIAMTGHIEAAVSLIVCNLLVIVTRLYRILHPADEDREDDATSRNAPTAERLTRHMTTRSSTILTLTEISTQQFLDLSDSSVGSGSTAQSQLDSRPTGFPGRVSSIPQVDHSVKNHPSTQ